jgi:(2Fe-2S) ferredoxin
MTPEKAAKVLDEHIKGGKVVEEYTISNAKKA